jgi:hypothetical protein
MLNGYPTASCGVSKTARNEASFEEYDPERFKAIPILALHHTIKTHPTNH